MLHLNSLDASELAEKNSVASKCLQVGCKTFFLYTIPLTTILSFWAMFLTLLKLLQTNVFVNFSLVINPGSAKLCYQQFTMQKGAFLNISSFWKN